MNCPDCGDELDEVIISCCAKEIVCWNCGYTKLVERVGP